MTLQELKDHLRDTGYLTNDQAWIVAETIGPRIAVYVKAEVEACARLCDELDTPENSSDYAKAARWCAARIRAR